MKMQNYSPLYPLLLALHLFVSIAIYFAGVPSVLILLSKVSHFPTPNYPCEKCNGFFILKFFQIVKPDANTIPPINQKGKTKQIYFQFIRRTELWNHVISALKQYSHPIPQPGIYQQHTSNTKQKGYYIWNDWFLGYWYWQFSPPHYLPSLYTQWKMMRKLTPNQRHPL